VQTVLVALGLSPIVAVVVLLALTLRRQWHSGSAVVPIQTRKGDDGDQAPPGAGVREPRRPLVPSGVGGVSLTLPDDAAADGIPASAPRVLVGDDPEQPRLAG
jgi:hypothetical protein